MQRKWSALVAGGLRTGVSSRDLSGISFLSFVYPSADWAVAAFRHQSANFEAGSETQGFFGVVPDSGESFRYVDSRTETRLETVTYGVAGAYRLTENLSFGLAVSYVEGTLKGRSDVFLPTAQALPDGPFGPNSYPPGARFTSTHVDLDSSAWTFNVGFLWHFLSRWSLGGIYRSGPTLDVTLSALAGPGFEPQIPEGTLLAEASGPGEFPGVFGLGMAFRSAGGAVTATFEWDHVQYSAITDSLRESVTNLDERVDDGDEFHAGLEYVFLRASPLVALRLGAWLDPDHIFKAETTDPLKQATIPPGDDTLHFAAGFGLAFERFQFDFGLDLSELVKTASVSVIWSF